MPADEYARRLTESRSRMVEGRATLRDFMRKRWKKDGKGESVLISWFIQHSELLLNCTLWHSFR
jgi:hypothetical protein